MTEGSNKNGLTASKPTSQLETWNANSCSKNGHIKKTYENHHDPSGN